MKTNNAVEALAAKPAERTAAVRPDNITGAFLNVCAGVSNLKRAKAGQVGSQKYNYATLEQVLDMVNPLLEANGLALIQYVDEDVLRALLLHESGEKMPLGGYNLGPIGKHQERGSAITYGRRYQLCAILGITQEDDDGAAASKGGMTSGVTPQAEFGTAVAFKKYYADTMGFIENMTAKDQATNIRKRIERVGKVDDAYEKALNDALELALDGLHLHE